MGRPLNIVFDMDGTLLDYEGWQGPDHYGHVKPEAAAFVNDLMKPGGISGKAPNGWALNIFTTRKMTPERFKNILQNLMNGGIPALYVQDINGFRAEMVGKETWSHNPPDTSQKPIWDIYVDDRSYYDMLESGGEGNKIDWDKLRVVCGLMEEKEARGEGLE